MTREDHVQFAALHGAQAHAVGVHSLTNTLTVLYGRCVFYSYRDTLFGSFLPRKNTGNRGLEFDVALDLLVL